MEIKKQYHDALYFAVAKINKKAKFALTPIQKSIMEKMIHYEKTYPQITFSNATIAEHLFCSELTIKDAIEDLYRKGYLTSTTEFHTNYGSPAKSRIITIKWDKLQEVLDMIPTTIDIKKKAPKEVKLKSEVVTPEVIKEAPKSMFGEQRDIFQQLEEYNSEVDYEHIEEPITLVELEYDEMVTLDVIESDDILTDIFKDEIKISFDSIRMISKNNELNKETKALLLEIFQGIISIEKKYINKYQQLGGTKIKNELIN